MKRIIMHWTAGGHEVGQTDREHYHEIVGGDGSRVAGIHRPEANINLRTGQYAAHTLALNTGSIGLSMAAMRGARETPFSAGDSPITRDQLRAFVEMVAEYALTYKIPVSRKTILTHAEVQPTLGVWQRGKWDITWLPGMERPGDAVMVGDGIRQLVAQEIKAISRDATPRRRRWIR